MSRKNLEQEEHGGTWRTRRNIENEEEEHGE